ncbi:hypothetical protein [Pokkaliibacter plantistimulans]|uniref:hypothetical protein n=1 Tax=Pokkaliibacter plantistimulans TaxID=1635171 RepID=UPI0010581BB2|nr:hypothetical protein [Pokkaliibacter plantistimulans]
MHNRLMPASHRQSGMEGVNRIQDGATATKKASNRRPNRKRENKKTTEGEKTTKNPKGHTVMEKAFTTAREHHFCLRLNRQLLLLT